MKAFRAALIVLFMICWCKVNAQHDSGLTGKWRVDVPRTMNSISGAEKVKYDKMAENDKNKIKKNFENRIFHFTGNDRVNIQYTINNKSGNVEGQWTFNSKENMLTIIASGATKHYEVKWETKDRIRLIYKTASKGLLKSLYLTRSN